MIPEPGRFHLGLRYWPVRGGDVLPVALRRRRSGTRLRASRRRRVRLRRSVESGEEKVVVRVGEALRHCATFDSGNATGSLADLSCLSEAVPGVDSSHAHRATSEKTHARSGFEDGSSLGRFSPPPRAGGRLAPDPRLCGGPRSRAGPFVRYQNPSAATIRRFAHSHDPTEPHPAARLLHRCCRAPRSAGPAAQQSIRNILIFKGALPGAAAFQARLSCQAGPVGRTPST